MTSSRPDPEQQGRILPELLAPAGSPEAFRAAVAAGADAVYLGGKQFGARKYAGNFTGAAIEDAIAFAHARGVKIYVTINTLIHDRELARAAEYLVWLYSAGADAALVQDTGLATLARRVVPGLPLHASTQMTVHNADGVRSAAAMGFSRVVLARELALGEIGEIARETAGTGTGLEIFAHGALCFSYSGQCHLSSFIGGRSGNRGMCAQPCRKPYTLVTGSTDSCGRQKHMQETAQDGTYLLSPKDLCTYPRLGELVQSPVVSLKIEGRMKSPEYVAVVTAAYRRALDAIAAGRDPAEDNAADELALAFNRGFSDGYLFGKRHAAIMGREQPGNRGLFIGTVEQYRKDGSEARVLLSTGITPGAGDGLYIDDANRKNGGLGFPLNASPARAGDRVALFVPGPVSTGSRVFMTHSTALAAKARRIMAGDCPELRRPVPVDCEVRVDSEGHVAFSGMIDAGDRHIPFRYRPDFALARARTRPLTRELLLKNLNRTGGTPFLFRTLTLSYDGTRFAPVAEINRMRREFLARGEDLLVAAYRPPPEDVRAARVRLATALHPPGTAPGTVTIPGTGKQPLLVVYTDSCDGVTAAVQAGFDEICFEPGIGDSPARCRCNGPVPAMAEQVASAMMLCRSAGIPFVWKLPRITRRAELARIRSILPGLCAEGLSACMAGNMGAVAALQSCCPGIRIPGSAGLNIFNHKAAQHAASACSSVTLSPELSGAEIGELVRKTRAAGCTVSFSLVVQGTAEAMIAENCILEPALCGKDCRPCEKDGIFFGLRDATGRIFPVTADASCRTHIRNADETCLIDRLPEILQAGVSSLVIDARGRTPEYIRETARIYREALQATGKDAAAVPAALDMLMQQIRPLAAGSLTAMHFARGLKEA